jgi:hypothetical protein
LDGNKGDIVTKLISIVFEGEIQELVPDDYEVTDPWSFVLDTVGSVGVNVIDVEDAVTIDRPTA